MEQVLRYVRKLRLPLEAVAAYLLDMKDIVFEYSENIFPGMYVYVDNTFGSKIIPERQIKAVVGYVEGGTVYAVCLREENLPWSSEGLRVPEAQDLTDGATATQRILECAEEQKRKADAAQWCFDYDYDGVKKGEAFLPSVVELMKLGCDTYVINSALSDLKVKPFRGDYLSSTEFEEDIDTVLVAKLGRYQVRYGWPESGCDKAALYNVRPMIKIKI